MNLPFSAVLKLIPLNSVYVASSLKEIGLDLNCKVLKILLKIHSM